ncbi:HEPN domain-containing protein [Patescibacteria group bacterium]|nr:MAG: HEPN domain-containing protein [Patescibacteria group bacterium]
MDKPFELIKNGALDFIFLFSNADAFYISARRALSYGWVSVGCSNAHQAIELYVKAILRLNYEKERGHDLIKLLIKYKSRDPYFSTILGDPHKVEFLKQLSEGYLIHRYGEAGANSNCQEIINSVDELTFNLRNIYLHNIKSPSNKIYMPDKLQQEFLSGNAHFSEVNLTKNPLAQMGLPSDMELPEGFTQ